MALQSQIAPLIGRMNQSDHPKIVKTEQGEVFSRVNLRPSSVRGNKYANEKIKGTAKHQVTLPAGENKMIGFVENREQEAIVYFLFNSLGNYSVFRFFKNTSVLEKVFYAEPSLDLEDSNIKGFVAEGDLYWVNGSKMPKQFNLDRATNYTNNRSGKKYSAEDKPFDVHVFPWIKRPPQFAPTAEYNSVVSDGTNVVNYNNLRGKLWQFKYNYRYKNNQESAYSPISKVPLPQAELMYSGDWLADMKVNNALEVVINTGGPDVKAINVAVRDCSEYNTGSFYRFETIDKFDKQGNRILEDFASYEVTFLNNKTLTSIDTPIGNRYFDDVPLSAKDAIMLDGKWGALALPKKGYDDIEVDYSIEAIKEDVNFDTAAIYMSRSEQTRFGFMTTDCSDPKTATVHRAVDFTIPDIFYPNAVYQISVPRKSGTVTVTYTSGPFPPNNFQETIRNSLFDQLEDKIDSCDGAPLYFRKSGTGILRLWYMGVTTPIPHRAVIITAEALNSYKGMKRGQYHPFSIVYNDEFGRYNVVYGDEELFSPEINADFDSEGGGALDFHKVVKPRITINHQPPAWATTYRIVYSRNKSYTYCLYVPVVKQIIGDGANGIPAGKTFLQINQSLENMRESYPYLQIADYVWQRGDRIKRSGYPETYEIAKDYVRTYDEGEETKQEMGFLIGGVFETVLNGYDVIDNLEIYRPNTSPNDTIYQEIGEEYKIINPGTANRYHAGADQDQTANQPAVSTLDFGDVYYRTRLTANNSVPFVFAEDTGFSDYYQSSAIDVGRVCVKIDAEQKLLNRVVRTENYLENTETNRLNVFLPGTPYFDVSDEYGLISSILEVGDLMKVLQSHKETSVFIGKVTAKEADGQDLVMLSDKVFGAYHRFDEIRGTTYPRSVAVKDRWVYYFDESTGEFIRSAPNGQIALCEKYNMKNWFEAKAKELRKATGYKDVIVTVDNNYNEVLVSFIINEQIDTIVFSEDEESKGWSYFVTYKTGTARPENFASSGDSVFSFLKGELYQHDIGGLNDFYGTITPCSLSFIMNGIPTAEKRLKNIEIETNANLWNGEISCEAKLNYGSQKTIFTPAIMKEVDSKLVLDVLKNIIRRNGQEDMQLLYNGHDLISDTFKVQLETSGQEDVILQEVQVKFLIST